MSCFHPQPAHWIVHKGRMMAKRVSADTLSRRLSGELVGLPCGTCLGCRTADARAWAVRCRLEAFEHKVTSVATFTYDERSCPEQLSKVEFSGCIKRLRNYFPPQSVRYFASGEYGDRFGRPHYHAILYGVRRGDPSVQKSWPFGFVHTDVVSDEAIAYVAGYVVKKLIEPEAYSGAWISGSGYDAETGEVMHVHQWRSGERAAPFRLMSRRPGIGGAARARNPRAFRDNVVNGVGVEPAPLYLRQLWLDGASAAELRTYGAQKFAEWMEREKAGAFERERVEASEMIARSRRRLYSGSL